MTIREQGFGRLEVGFFYSLVRWQKRSPRSLNHFQTPWATFQCMSRAGFPPQPNLYQRYSCAVQ